MLAMQAYNVKQWAMKETTPAAMPPASIDGVKDLTIFLVILPKNESLGTI
jgi:hypothetical protein